MFTNSISAKSGLFDISMALFFAVFTSGLIHRIATVICILFSGILLFFLKNVSNNRYTSPVSSSNYSSINKKRK